MCVCSQTRSQSSSDRTIDKSLSHNARTVALGAVLESSKEYKEEIKWHCGSSEVQMRSRGVRSLSIVRGSGALLKKFRIYKNLKNGRAKCGKAVVISVWVSRVSLWKN